jgi:hypothetical protein
MDLSTIGLSVIAGVLFVLYLARRRARLNNEQ